MSEKKFKVVITDSNFPTDEPERKVLGDIAEVYRYQCKTEDEIIEVAKDADGLLVQFAPVTRKVIESLTKAKVISRYGIGVDNVDLKAATEKGILVCNITYSVDDVADHTLALMLCAVRKIAMANKAVKEGKWDWKMFRPIYKMKTMTVGIIGLGKVGRLVAKRLKGFECKILGYDPYVSDEVFKEYGVERVDLETLLRNSDIVTLHTPLTDETRHIINEETLKLMKPTAYIINTARGPLIDEKALYKALKEGRLAGAAMDVLEQEPIRPDNPLRELDNVIITPHMAFYSEQVVEEIQTRTAENVAKVLKGEIPEFVVNKEVLKK